MSKHRYSDLRHALLATSRSGPRFKDLPVGTCFEWNEEKGGVNYPMKGLVLKKIDDRRVVTIRRPGTPPPAAWLGITEEEFFAPFDFTVKDADFHVRVVKEP